MIKHCPFCRLTRDEATPAFHRLFPEKRTTYEIILQTNHFYVVLDAAPLIEGHCLIVPKVHCQGIYSVWRDHRQEILDLQAKITKMINKVWNKGVVLCEHGADGTAEETGCIQHAHIHIIPSTTTIADAVRHEGLKLKQNINYDTFPRNQHKQYFMLQDLDGREYTAFSRKIPSQLVRRVFATQNSLSAWHWRDYVDMANSLNTRNTIISGYDKLHSLSHKV